MKLPATRLVIRQTPGPLRPLIGSCILNEVRGGPESLLQWLETQLGLPTIVPHRANCVTEFASAITSALQADDNSAVMQSMRNDLWATACELLARNDELTLDGWVHETYAGNDPMIVDLKKINSNQSLVFLSVAERLKRIEQSLMDGQRLPPHSCELHEPVERWPVRWQSVLKHLSITSPSPTQPQGKPETTLRAIQDAIASSDDCLNSSKSYLFDASLRCVQTLSQNVAIEFVAAFLANNREGLHRTVIVCEDEYLSMQLDAAFARYQLPTMGASVCTNAHPALQIIPLALALCWEPVDPQRDNGDTHKL